MKKIMQDMPDRELDELFKTAADNVQYDFEQAAWQDLQQKMRGGWWSRRGIYWGSGLLLLLGVIFTVFWLNQPKRVSPNGIQQSALSQFLPDYSTQKYPTQLGQLPSQTKTDTKNIQGIPSQKDRTQKIQSNNTGSITPKVNQTPVVRTPAKVNTSKRTGQPFKHSSRNVNPLQIQNQPLTTRSNGQKVVTTTKKPGYHYNDIFNPKVKVTNGQKTDPKRGEKLGANQVKNNGKPAKNTSSDKDKNVVVLTPPRQMGKVERVEAKHSYEKQTFLPPMAQKTVVLSANENQAQTIRPGRKFSLIAQVSPDLSMVDQVALSDTRLGFGLLVEYEVIKNLSISTGANYSFKAYKANAESYTPKNGEWRWPTSPENIDATCNVLEIPLNIRYYFHNQSKHRLFISSGVSSYWMLNEMYNYTYSTRTQWNYSWELNNENQHMLSILNLSIGWQKKLNNRFSIQAEPFLKLPLGKVGGGQVNLKTTGILLGLKYDLF
ncbi:hypothetical protein BKI52_24910 [marine bacterium AO1-C]|nr:hypothetical protein BKI52_24910 [marine bacterium AO1-C]